jgi:hypothetical protein
MSQLFCQLTVLSTGALLLDSVGADTSCYKNILRGDAACLASLIAVYLSPFSASFSSASYCLGPSFALIRFQNMQYSAGYPAPGASFQTLLLSDGSISVNYFIVPDPATALAAWGSSNVASGYLSGLTLGVDSLRANSPVVFNTAIEASYFLSSASTLPNAPTGIYPLQVQIIDSL